jgi:hypothetical protein
VAEKEAGVEALMAASEVTPTKATPIKATPSKVTPTEGTPKVIM